MKKLVWLCGWMWLAVPVSATAGEMTPEFLEGTTRVGAEEVIDLVDEHSDLVIIDARKRSDYQKGHIEGAVNLPNTETTPESLAGVIPSKSTPVVFYCNGVKCGRSVESVQKTVSAGYSQVYWFHGGIQEREAKGLPLVKP